MPLRLPGILTGCLLSVLSVPVAMGAGPANVTVRAEGTTTTLIPRTTVKTNTTPVVKDGNSAHSCTGTSTAGALELASGGAWNGTWFDGFKYSVDSIKGETHTFGTTGDYYAFWVNNRFSSLGACDFELQEGDQVLFFADRCNDVGPAPDYECLDSRLPIALTAPANAGRGVPFTVHVDRFDKSGNPVALAGATVAGPAVSATTDAAGNAAISFADSGAFELKASKDPDYVRSEGRSICVHDGDDGTCGTTKPGEAPVVSTCATNGSDGLCGTTDRSAALGRITFASEQQHFAKGKGPRTLAGAVTPDPSGLRLIQLRLTRSDRPCLTYDGATEKLVKLKRCGAAGGKWFSVGDRQDWSYLLPERLGPGRWVLDIRTTDGAGNVDQTLQRGRNRIVFHVG
jgi:hypothetical protein